ncbi:MarR family winged helix-turn-helix transcriptional regulator [Nocardia sp. NPDC055321]
MPSPTGSTSLKALTGRTGYLLYQSGLLLVQAAEAALEESQGAGLRYLLVLELLGGRSDTSQRMVGELLDIDRTTIVDLIDKMEKNGHVKRSRNQYDRRRNDLNLTENGYAALAIMARIVHDVESELLSTLSVENKTFLDEMLATILARQSPDCAKPGIQ